MPLFSAGEIRQGRLIPAFHRTNYNRILIGILFVFD